ncbi:unnamed protein product [Paramecium primaurelia]|uniref:Protein kinase domain-containing protein n=1 Tax=Paramecium primaurelia TaxID=5886 RepID=A0A8S1PCX0_PARPR|nr:unnamed protein product [Paramecium primaurelia]
MLPQTQQNLIPKKKIEHYTYLMHEQIGRGYSSKVYKGKDENNGEVVAVKVIDVKAISNEIERQLINQEINALKLIQSVNVIKLHDYYHTNNNTYIITEYCNQGDLGKLIQQQGIIPEVEAFKILRHIINGFKEQIRKGVIHRDIKPTNILIKNSVPKLADYGFSKMIKAPKEKVFYKVGTPIYMSPESYLENKYSEKSDIWSIGVVYYQMLYGQCPWVINSESEFQESVSQLHFNRNVPISEESKDFLRRALQVDENQRLSLIEIDQHPLFLRRNTTALNKMRGALVSNSFNKSITNINVVRVNQTQQCTRSGSTSHKHQKSNQVKEKMGTIIQHAYQSFHYESQAEEIICNFLNQCKFVYRTCQLIDHIKYIQSPRLKEKIMGYFGREVMEIMNKLKEAYEKGINNIKVINFNHQFVIAILNKHQFRESYLKYKEFYGISQQGDISILKEVIRELNHQLRINEQNETGILLLDYLTYYYQVINSNNIQQFLDGKPINEIMPSHYQEIRVKIYNLDI